MNIITHTIGFAGIDMPVATFRGMTIAAAVKAYSEHYGHDPFGGFVVDDFALKPVIYLALSDADIETHGVLVLPWNHVVNT